MNVAVALISALVVLPPMLVWADERSWVSRGLVPQAVLDRATIESDTPQNQPLLPLRTDPDLV